MYHHFSPSRPAGIGGMWFRNASRLVDQPQLGNMGLSQSRETALGLQFNDDQVAVLWIKAVTSAGDYNPVYREPSHFANKRWLARARGQTEYRSSVRSQISHTPKEPCRTVQRTIILAR